MRIFSDDSVEVCMESINVYRQILYFILRSLFSSNEIPTKMQKQTPLPNYRENRVEKKYLLKFPFHFDFRFIQVRVSHKTNEAKCMLNFPQIQG